MNPNEIFDVTAKEKNILIARAARREKLRKLFIQETSNPYRHAAGVPLLDPAFARVEAAKVTAGAFFKPVASQVLFFYGGVVLPFAIAILANCRFRAKQEANYRSGKVAYKDRWDKLK